MLRIVTFSAMGLLLEIVIFAAIALLLIGIFVYQWVMPLYAAKKGRQVDARTGNINKGVRTLVRALCLFPFASIKRPFTTSVFHTGSGHAIIEARVCEEK